MAIAALRRIFCRGSKRKAGGGFARDDDGNTIVEFALIAPLFFTTLLAIFEVAMLFGTSVVLEGASSNAARALRTGKVFLASLPPAGTPTPLPPPDVAIQKATFEQVLCDSMILIRCSELSYNVESFDEFTTADGSVTCNGKGAILGSTPVDGKPAAANFDVGLPTQIVVVTIVYPYRPLIPNPLLFVGRDPDSTIDGDCEGLSMQSIFVFANEPFPTTL